MIFAQDAQAFVIAVAGSAISDTYYSLCREHPMRPDAPLAKVPAAVVLEAIAGRMSLGKLSGPGSVFQAKGLPEGLSLNFILQGRSSVETHFSVVSRSDSYTGTFATICHAATVASGAAPPDPPYPRPNFYSADELAAIFVKFEALVRELGVVAASVR
jgi:hypothetical protein